MATPAEILNIGPAAGQNHFSVQVAEEGETEYDTYDQNAIAAGLDLDPYFTPNATETAVQFHAPADGPTTPGSSFARCELRELDQSGENIKFNPFDGDEHWMHGRSKITHHPTSGPNVNNIGIVLAQLHNGTRDELAFRTQIVSGSLRLRYRENGSSVPTGTDTTSGSLEIVPAGEFNIVGVEFEWKIHLHSGNGTSCVADFYVNGNLWRRNTAFTNARGDDTSEGYYFKAGCYNQFNDSNVSASEYGQVELRDFQHWHTGWPTPGSNISQVVYRSSSKGTDPASTSTTAPKPDGVTEGDLLLAFHGMDADGSGLGSMTAPAGWTQIGENSGPDRIPYLKVWQKIATASEPASYTFPKSDFANGALVIVALHGHDPSNPVASGPAFNQSATNTTSHPAPSVAGVPGGLLLTAHLADTNGTPGSYTPPSGMTERQDASATWVTLEVNTEELDSSAATGVKTATHTGSTDYNCVSLVVKPVAVPKSPLLVPRIRRLRHLLVR